MLTKVMLTLLLITFLSCGAPTIRNTERCVMAYKNIYDSSGALQLDTKGDEVVSGHCRCGEYKIAKDGLAWVDPTKNYNRPLSYCTKMIGWRPDQWAQLYKDIDELRVWVLQQEAAAKND